MRMSSSKILIIGASGGVGGSLLRQLLTLPSSPSIRVSTRDLSKAKFPSSVETVQGDLAEPSSYARLFNGVDRIFMYNNSSAPLQQLLAAAKEGGVKHIVFLSSMTVEFNPDGVVGKAHQITETAIQKSGLKYTFIRPRNFASNSRRWIPIIQRTGKLWITYPNAHTAPVSEDDMAAVAATALTTDKLVNQAVPLSGTVSISQEEQVEAISRLRVREGKGAVELIVRSPEDWRANMLEHTDMSLEFVEQLLTWWALTDGKPEKIQASERITGKPSQSFHDWLEVNKADFL